MFKKIIFIIIFLIIGLSIGIAVYLKESIYTPKDNNSKKIELFTVDKTSTKILSENLKSQGFIKSSLAFELYAKYKKFKLQSGQYELSGSMSVANIANKIASGEVAQFKVTFPEGWRLEQIADRLEARKIVSKDDFLKAAAGQEGYLFPDTYFIKSGMSAEDIVSLMKNNFKNRTANLVVTPDIVILASIVEREASKNDDRSQIAAVYANRLKLGMKMEADPTVQYAKGSWAAITQSDYHNVESPYNTYLQPGLPPGPICNPGLLSLEAATKPAQNDYLYFFHTKDGRTVFSKTFAEHDSNLAKYRAGKL